VSDDKMRKEIVNVIKSHIENYEIQSKLFDEDMAKARVEREKMGEDISNISRALQEIRDLLKDEKAKADARPFL
jgi:Mg2+ and Co2+ transporter CorA